MTPKILSQSPQTGQVYFNLGKDVKLNIDDTGGSHNPLKRVKFISIEIWVQSDLDLSDSHNPLKRVKFISMILLRLTLSI